MRLDRGDVHAGADDVQALGRRFLGLQAADHLGEHCDRVRIGQASTEHLHDRAVNGLDESKGRGVALDEHQCGLVVAHCPPERLGEGRGGVQLRHQQHIFDAAGDQRLPQ